MKTTTYMLPSYWVSYLINGDASALGAQEQATIDQFLAKNGNPNIYSCSDESHFSRRNDANNLGGDVLEYTAIIEES